MRLSPDLAPGGAHEEDQRRGWVRFQGARVEEGQAGQKPGGRRSQEGQEATARQARRWFSGPMMAGEVWLTWLTRCETSVCARDKRETSVASCVVPGRPGRRCLGGDAWEEILGEVLDSRALLLRVVLCVLCCGVLCWVARYSTSYRTCWELEAGGCPWALRRVGTAVRCCTVPGCWVVKMTMA